jgi:hypothetical protein
LKSVAVVCKDFSRWRSVALLLTNQWSTRNDPFKAGPLNILIAKDLDKTAIIEGGVENIHNRLKILRSALADLAGYRYWV